MEDLGQLIEEEAQLKKHAIKKIDMERIRLPLKSLLRVIDQSKQFILELRLNSCNILSQECKQIAENYKFC